MTAALRRRAVDPARSLPTLADILATRPSDVTPRALRDALWRQRAAIGVTRLSLLTGFDTIGFPVAQAARPLARSNTGAQGRGPDIVCAEFGALLEACETFAAETVPWESARLACAAEEGVTALYAASVAMTERDRWARRERAWIDGYDLLGGQVIPVPVALVDTDYTLPRRHPDDAFARCTTGLGAGPDGESALRQGLLETLERDAVWRGANGSLPRRRIVGLTASGVREPALANLLAAVERARVRCEAFALGPLRDAGGRCVHVVTCCLFGEAGTGLARAGAAEGSAASHDPETALLGALGEAVQARASLLAGVRDDLTRDLYRPLSRRTRPTPIAQMATRDETVDVGELEPGRPLTPDALASLCAAMGANAVLVVPLMVAPAVVVRVVAPPLAMHAGRAGG